MQQIAIVTSKAAVDTVAVLGGVRFELRLRWNWRTSAWYLSITEEATGDDVCTSRRLSPGSVTCFLPDGSALSVTGEDPYVMGALGDSLLLWYFPVDELDDLLAQAAADGDPDPVLI